MTKKRNEKEEVFFLYSIVLIIKENRTANYAKINLTSIVLVSIQY